MPTTDDPVLAAYFGVAERIESLTESARLDALTSPVPTCPAWTVEDVVRHLVGITADWVEGRLDGYGSDGWTEQQIALYDDSPVSDVVARWAPLRDATVAIEPNPLMGPVGTWLFGDACVHEADIRPVLAPGTRPPDDAVALATKAGIARWRGHVAEHGLDPFVVDAVGSREWRIGDTDENSPRVRVDPYELFRALYGRRSREQVAAWEWRTDPALWLDAGLPYPFTWAAQPVTGE